MSFPDIAWEHVLNNFYQEYCNQLFPELPIQNDICVSFSGGADSVLTLAYAISFHRFTKSERRLVLFYLDHYQNSSDAEPNERLELLKYYINLLKSEPKLNLELRIYSRDIERAAKRLKQTFEYTGAKYRNYFLRAIAREFPAITIWKGHNLTDWFETVIMRLNRGSSKITPILPIEEIYPKQVVVTPLAFMGRNSVREICREHSLPWWDDPENLSENITRNKIRMAALDYNETGLRKSALLITNSENFCADWLIVKHALEYRLRLTEKDIPEYKVILPALRAVGMGTLSAHHRNLLYSQKRLKVGPFVIEMENWNQQWFLVVRRGDLLAAYRTDSYNFSAQETIALQFGHKKVKKIISEMKLSARQKRLIRIQRNIEGEIMIIDPQIAGLKSIVSINSIDQRSS